MGTLTKKLHILKAGGTEETCDIYTTPEEVGGSPYLALEVDGTKGYVKLGSTTDANATHLRVEKSGTTYAAWKKATVDVPTGGISVGEGDKFTAPPGVKVIKVYYTEYEYDDTSHSMYTYVGVTPGKTYELQCYTFIVWPEGDPGRETEDGIYLGSIINTKLKTWFQRTPADEIQDTRDLHGFKLRWSPEINKMAPTYTDY